jgi:hypothetical protein
MLSENSCRSEVPSGGVVNRSAFACSVHDPSHLFLFSDQEWLDTVLFGLLKGLDGPSPSPGILSLHFGPEYVTQAHHLVPGHYTCLLRPRGAYVVACPPMVELSKP